MRNEAEPDSGGEQEQILTPRTVSYLLEKREIHQIGGAKEIKFTLKNGESVRRSTKPIGEGSDGEGSEQIGAEVKKIEIDHYNGSRPIDLGGIEGMAVREEPRDSQLSSVKWWRHNIEKDTWEPLDQADELPGCQDPSYQGELQSRKYISVVNTKEKDKDKEEFDYWSELYELNSDFKGLKAVAKSPLLCKGLHLSENPDDGTIDGFIRRQGEGFARGKVCYFNIKTVEELQGVMDNLDTAAETIEMFAPEEWGGINDLHRLPGGRLGVVGHIARFRIDADGKEVRDYYVTSAIFDPKTKQMSELKIIMTMDDLKDEKGNPIKAQFEPKRADLDNVLYPTNSVLEGDKLTIYVGAKDAKPFVFSVKNPWASSS